MFRDFYHTSELLSDYLSLQIPQDPAKLLRVRIYRFGQCRTTVSTLEAIHSWNFDSSFIRSSILRMISSSVSAFVIPLSRLCDAALREFLDLGMGSTHVSLLIKQCWCFGTERSSVGTGSSTYLSWICTWTAWGY